MNVRTTIILLVVMVVLGGYVFWSGNNSSGTGVDDASSSLGLDTSMDEARTPILSVNTADIQAIEVTNAEGTTVSLARAGDSWNLTQPDAEPADAGAVTQVITDLVGLTATRSITETSEDLSAYGLDKPAYEVILSGENGELARLRLGGANPNGSATYVQRDTEPTIYLVSNFILDGVRNWITTPPVKPTPVPTPTEAPATATPRPTQPTGTVSPDGTGTTAPVTATPRTTAPAATSRPTRTAPTPTP